MTLLVCETHMRIGGMGVGLLVCATPLIKQLPSGNKKNTRVTRAVICLVAI